MSAKFTGLVWENSGASGTTLLVMLALAEVANTDGEIKHSVSAIADMARATLSEVEVSIKALNSSGELDTSFADGVLLGRIALGYPNTGGEGHLQIDPEPVSFWETQEQRAAKSPIPKYHHKELKIAIGERDPVTSADVQRVLDAAGIVAPPGQPLYWSRREHRQELEDALGGLMMDVTQVVDLIKTARAEGKQVADGARRIQQVLAVLG